jgi:hypothetical protein
MNRRNFWAAALLLLAAILTPAAQAQGHQPIEGLWVFNITILGTPPCQCIAAVTFNTDGTLYAPANDHFSGPLLGVWVKNEAGGFNMSGVQSNINPDGSAGGLFTYKATFAFTGQDTMAATVSTFQLVDNSGAVLFSGSSTIKATRVRVTK